jgi:hypothetical protein
MMRKRPPVIEQCAICGGERNVERMALVEVPYYQFGRELRINDDRLSM